MIDLASLRARLIAFRSDVLRQLAEADQIQPGHLRLFADTVAALAALDALDTVPLDVAQAERVVLVDGGAGIWLVAYTASKQVSAVELSPQRAIAIAGQMIAAALRSWGTPRARESGQRPSAPPVDRGSGCVG
jgi:hypothetical protein